MILDNACLSDSMSDDSSPRLFLIFCFSNRNEQRTKNIAHAYVQQKCVTGDTSGLSLLAVKLPEQAFFPRLLEGGLEVSLVSPTSVLANADTGDGSGLTVVSTDNETDLASSPWSSLSLATEESGSGGEVDGVIWNVSALFPDLIDWTIFPSIGLLRPGERCVARSALF